METQTMVEGYTGEVIGEESSANGGPMRKCGSPNGCFDCNICLEFAADPVVTLCGHLFCWPCIYKWFQQSASTSSQLCPVCKATLSREALVPLYGRGINGKQSHYRENIPHRPSVQRELVNNQSAHEIREQYQSYQSHYPHHNHQQEYPYVNTSSDYNLTSPPLGTIGVFHSTAGGFLAGMAVDFLPLIFRNQQFTGMYYPSPYYRTANGENPRLRRQELKVQRSLHQIWVFLFCCAILCLLLF